MRTNPFYDAWLFLTGQTDDHAGSGVGLLLVVLFWALLLASVWIAWRNWQDDPARRTPGHLATWFMRVMIGCMWFQGSIWKLPLPVSGGLSYWTEEISRNAAFDVHTYKHTTIGFEADIKAMPQQFAYSKTFFDRFYRPENVVVLVTGDIDPSKTLALVKQHYGTWKKGYQAPKVPAEPPQTKERRIYVPSEGQTQPILTLNFKGAAFAPGDKTYVAARLIGPLAFGETSPLTGFRR